MTAIIDPRSVSAVAGHATRPMLGFGPFLRKEFSEWVRGGRAIVVGLIVTALAVLGTLGTWIEGNVEGMAVGAAVDPTVEALRLFGPPIVALVTIFATMSLLAGEREGGTLAWSLTKPLSRSAVLAAKWTAAVLVLAIVAIVIPTAVAAIVSTLAYGAAPDPLVVVPMALLSIAIPIFFVTIAIAAGTILPTQAGIAGVGIAVLLLPYLVGAILPVAVVEALPTGIGAWAGGLVGGEAVPVSTPVVWAATIVALAAASVLAFRRSEF
jgi:ABC-type transport system involved in multi-copper enzyme maturation permease subunit